MKILAFSSLFLFLSLQINAQLRLAVKAGYNNSSAEYRPKDRMIKQSISSFQLGFLGQLSCNKILLSSNILFNQKGNYSDNNEIISDDGQQVTYRLNYLETNILAGYRFTLSKKAGISIAAGPYFGVGLSGTEKGTGSSLLETYKIDRKIHFSNTKESSYNNNYFKPFDFGLDINASLNYKKYFLYFNFGKGLVDRFSSDLPDWNSRNNVFSLGAGYYFK